MANDTTTLISITISSEDIRLMVEELTEDGEVVTYEEALARATEWARAIEDTASTLVNEQVENVLRHGSP